MNVSLVAVMLPLLEIAPPSLPAESPTNVSPTILLPPWVSSAPPLDAESFENVSFIRLTPAEASSSPPPLPLACAPVIVRSESVILPVGKMVLVAVKTLSPTGAVTVTPGPPVIVSVELLGSSVIVTASS